MELTSFFLLMQFSSLVPVAIGIIRYRKIDPSYRPFVLWLTLGFINESVNYILIKLVGTNVISFNIFQLIESVLIIYQFRVWGFLKDKPRLLNWIGIIFIIAWITQNLVYQKIFAFSPFFRIFYAFIIVLLIVNEIIYIANETSNVFKNAKFIICTTMIIFFIYQILYEGALIISSSQVKNSSNMIIEYLGYVNAFLNLLYAWALLVIPKKTGFYIEN